MLSIKPLMVTFGAGAAAGAGACANDGGANTPRRARTATARLTPLIITASSLFRVHSRPHTPWSKRPAGLYRTSVLNSKHPGLHHLLILWIGSLSGKMRAGYWRHGAQFYNSPPGGSRKNYPPS